MCQKARVAKAPFTSQVSTGTTWINDADGLPVAVVAAPREDARGPLSVNEMKQWIADNTALFVAAPAMVRYIRAKVIAAVYHGDDQEDCLLALSLLADASNTSVEFEWEQIRRAIESERQANLKRAA